MKPLGRLLPLVLAVLVTVALLPSPVAAREEAGRAADADISAAVAGAEPLTDVAEITAGADHACARLNDGTARCWGSNNGALGDGTTMDRLRPVLVSNEAGTGPLTGVTEIAAGGDHTCARLDDGSARCWGWNYFGGLGDGTTTPRSRPVVVANEAGTGPHGRYRDHRALLVHVCPAR